ncbi:hypothetical protein ACFQVC_05550 [Streptomyces monticola]|uniref:ABM domain-containing protein n=1 Tax=Streptomyces monticola TaxID=2666263 RepID=A0ABW2JDM9_9ACTN
MASQQVMIRWKVRPDALERHQELLQTVYEELKSIRPEVPRYDTYQLEDKVTFVSFVELIDGPGVLGGLPAFGRYRGELDAMCDEAPSVTPLHCVGEYAAQL